MATKPSPICALRIHLLRLIIASEFSDRGAFYTEVEKISNILDGGKL